MTSYRFYSDLAPWWPLISPPQEYADEAAYAASLLRSARIPVTDVLELGSGGGNNASHLKAGFAMTLVDVAEEMLDVSRRLNPECEHIRGDMRSVRLGRTFDAVFIHDAVTYLTTEDDLSLAMGTAYEHCREGGVVVIVPDETLETFEPDTSHGGSDGEDGRAARYLEWTWDPDPTDHMISTEYVFLLRDTDGAVTRVHETHHYGLFSRDEWLRLLTECGFVATRVVEETSDTDRVPRDVFIGSR